MSLSNSLVEQFVKVTTNDDETTKETTVYGTIVKSGNSDFVQLDGSELLTPVTSTISVKDGDRVTVMIKNHTAIVTGNITDPSASNSKTEEIGNKINEFEIVIADKVSTDEFEAEKGRIDDLVADTVLIKEELVANEAIIEDLQADNVTIKGDLTAVNGEIQNLKTTKLDAELADLKYATIENLEATNAEIHNLDVDYGNFKVTTTETLNAVNASITNLDAEKLDAEQANLMYANIDFANIGKLAIENFFSKSGMIDDLVVGDGTVTGKLVGVTIVGDLIEGGTVKADKLVVQGSDGLYYKLNITGETVAAEQTEYNSLNGSIITAKSITAEKVNVNDLVAFGATIGGFKITDSSIYSGTKETATNTTRGIYMDDTGQLSIGDSNNYLRYFQTEDGEWKLEISTQQTNVEIGGTNLFLNSRFNENVYYWTTEAGDEMPEVKPEPEPEPEQELKSIDIAMVDGIPCAVMNSESSSYIYQNVAPRLVTEDNTKVYIFSADLNLVDYVAGTAPEIKLYLEGKYADGTGTLQDIIVTTVSGNSDITTVAGQGWTRVNWIVSLNAIPSYTNSLDYLNVGIKGSDFGGNLYFKNLKFEKGNTPTDWSPAPEDYSNEIDDAVNESANTIKDQYTAMINQAADQINLIVQKLQQTTTQQGTTISNISNQLQITSDMAQFVKTTVETLQDVVDGKIDSVTIEEWARFDGASLELGTSDSPFKCLLTNTELAFYQGDNKVAWISNNELHVLTAVIATSIGCGNFMFIDEGSLGFSLI